MPITKVTLIKTPVLTCVVFLVDDEPGETRLANHGRGLDDKLVGVRRVRRALLVGGGSRHARFSGRRVRRPPQADYFGVTHSVAGHVAAAATTCEHTQTTRLINNTV